jgi:hypothetical protein
MQQNKRSVAHESRLHKPDSLAATTHRQFIGRKTPCIIPFYPSQQPPHNRTQTPVATAAFACFFFSPAKQISHADLTRPPQPPFSHHPLDIPLSQAYLTHPNHLSLIAELISLCRLNIPHRFDFPQPPIADCISRSRSHSDPPRFPLSLPN